MIEENNNFPEEENTNPGGCPCKYTTPCDDMCSCVNPVYSFGCRRCCSTGSMDQRILQAKKLAKVIDAAYSDLTNPWESDKVRDCNNCGCADCNPHAARTARWTIVCEKCGNDRCAHASHHKYKCTNHNSLDQEYIEE